MHKQTGYIPLFRLANDSIVCGPSVHSTEDCARNAQPILSPFALLAVDVPSTNDAPVVDLDDWSAAVRAQVSSVCIGFLQFQARPKAERMALAAEREAATKPTASIPEAAAERAARAYYEAGSSGFSPTWEQMCETEGAQWKAAVVSSMTAALVEFADALTTADRMADSEAWQPIETAPRDGTEVLLAFAQEASILGKVYGRVRQAHIVHSEECPQDWSIPYYTDNPPIAWRRLPAAPTNPASQGGG